VKQIVLRAYQLARSGKRARRANADQNLAPNISRRRYWLVVAYVGLFGIVILSLVPGSWRPHIMDPRLEHFAAYALAGLAFGLGLRHIKPIVKCGVSLVALAGLLEELQHFSPGRHPEVAGFLASSAGAWIGLVLAISIVAKLNEPHEHL
jgi:hypothetical protein